GLFGGDALAADPGEEGVEVGAHGVFEAGGELAELLDVVPSVLVARVLGDGAEEAVLAAVDADGVADLQQGEAGGGELAGLALEGLLRDPLAARELVDRHVALPEALGEVGVVEAEGLVVARDQEVDGAGDEVAAEPLVGAGADGTAAEGLDA